MADNVDVTEGAGKTVASDDIQVDATHAQGQVQFVKLVDGTLNGTGSVRVNQAVKANALTVAPASDISDATYIGDIKFGEALYTEDIATPATIVGFATMVERDDALGGLTPAEGDWAALRCDANGALWVHDNVVNTLLTTIDSDTGNMLTALQLIDNAVDGNYLNVNLNAAGVDLSMNSGVLTAQTLRVTIATDDEVNNLLGTIDTDTGNMVTALEIMDDWDESDRAKVNLIVGQAGVQGAEGNITALTQRVTLATDDDSVAHLATIAGDTTSMDGKITACNTGAVVISSGTITTVSTVTSLSQLGGQAINLGEGVIATGTQRVTLATDDDSVASLGIMDDWDATHASAASADGPQIMGAGYSAALPTDIGADGDAARICTDRFGRILLGLMPQNFQATFNSADAQAAAPVKAKTGSRKMYILSLVVSTDTEMNIKFQDDNTPTVLIQPLYLAANGGAHLTWPPEAPLVCGTNFDFDVVASASGNISVTITGYLAV